MTALIAKSFCIENSAVVLLARIRNGSGSYIQQSDISTLTYKIFDKTSQTPTTVIASGTLTISAVVSNALQTDARWSADSTGYNFAAPLPGTSFPEGNTVYRVEVKVTPSAADSFYCLWDLDCVDIFSE